MIKKIALITVLAFSFNAHAGKIRDFCRDVFAIAYDPWPYAEYDNQQLAFHLRLYDDSNLKKEIRFRLESIEMSERDKLTLMEALHARQKNSTADFKKTDM